MKLRSKILIAGAVTSSVLAGGAAFAFFTGVGAGGGTATAGTPTPLIFSGNASAALFPGQDIDLPISVLNSNTGPVRVDNIYVTAQYTNPALRAACPVEAATLDVDSNVPGSMTTPVVLGTTTIRLVDTFVDQTTCIGGAVTISYSTTAPAP